MSGGADILSLKEDDVTKMLAAETHLGETNGPDFQMAQYVFKVKSDGEPEPQIVSSCNITAGVPPRYCHY